MNNSFKVSIIIPNYNHEVFLERRISSVLNQTYQNFEIILLDDASTDESQTILNKYSGHSKISNTIFNEVNSGSVFIQWIKGILLAKGDYVWIAESDDYADSQFLENTVGLLDKNEQLGMVFTDSYKVNASDEEFGMISKSKKHLQKLMKDGCVINHTNLTEYILNKLVIVNASSVLFKKTALLELDFEVLKTLKNTGDIFSYIGIALKHDILYFPEPLNYMRLHAHNSTKANKKSGQVFKDKLLLLDYYLEDFKQSKINNKGVNHFLFGLIFFSVDYSHSTILKNVINRMFALGFFSRKKQVIIKSTLFLYSNFTHNGRPHFVRKYLKFYLQKRF